MPPKPSTAAAGPDRIVLRCAAELVTTTVHVRTGAHAVIDAFDAFDAGPSAAGAGDDACVTVLDTTVTLTTGPWGLVPIEGEALPVPDLGVAPGEHRVVVATRAGQAALQMEEDHMDAMDALEQAGELENAPLTEPPTGPEEWLVWIYP